MTAWRHRYAPHLGIVDPAQPFFRHSAGADPVAQIRFAAARGFPAICDNSLMLRPADERRRMRDALAEHDMPFSSYVDHPGDPTLLWTTHDAALIAGLRDRLSRAFDVGAELSASHLTIVALSDGSEAAAQMARMAENLAWAGPLAAEAGIVLALEAVSPTRLPGVLVRTVEDAAHIIDRSGAGNVRLLFDCMHAALESGDIVAAFGRVARHVGLIQLSELGRREPEPGGAIEMLMRAALAAGYDGLFELEHMHAEASAEGEQASLCKLAMIDAALA